MFVYTATVLRVVDGDTVDLNVDLGFRTWRKDRFRLYGIDAPERGQKDWSVATQALEELLPVGSTVTVRTHHPRERDATDKYGRWLGTIYTAENVDVGAVLVRLGLAIERTYT